MFVVSVRQAKKVLTTKQSRTFLSSKSVNLCLLLSQVHEARRWNSNKLQEEQKQQQSHWIQWVAKPWCKKHQCAYDSYPGFCKAVLIDLTPEMDEEDKNKCNNVINECKGVMTWEGSRISWKKSSCVLRKRQISALVYPKLFTTMAMRWLQYSVLGWNQPYMSPKSYFLRICYNDYGYWQCYVSTVSLWQLQWLSFFVIFGKATGTVIAYYDFAKHLPKNCLHI